MEDAFLTVFEALGEPRHGEHLSLHATIGTGRGKDKLGS